MRQRRVIRDGPWRKAWRGEQAGRSPPMKIVTSRATNDGGDGKRRGDAREQSRSHV